MGKYLSFFLENFVYNCFCLFKYYILNIFCVIFIMKSISNVGFNCLYCFGECKV